MTLVERVSTPIVSGWQMKKASSVSGGGVQLTTQLFPTDGIKATVPGTVLTTLVDQKKVDDPYFDLNNTIKQDISTVTPAHYTYWFYTKFDIAKKTPADRQWLSLRGINYTASVYLNGHLVSQDCDGVAGNDFLQGMFRRFMLDITDSAV